jgi:hypothetical protein
MTTAVPKGRKPLFRTEADLWRGFLIFNLLIAPALGFAAALLGDAGGEGLVFILGYLAAAVILVANFTMWVAARRMGVRAHWLILVWMLACLFTVVVFGAATPVNMALGLLGAGSFTPLGD